MRLLPIALALSMLLLTGCYRITVDTGAPPSPTVIDIPWQMSFAAGLIPPPVVDVADDCAQGVARVHTERSFLNVLATGVTSNIISPMHTTVVCAAGPVAR